MKKILSSLLCLCLIAFSSDVFSARKGKHSGKRAATSSRNVKKSSQVSKSNGKRAASTGRKSSKSKTNGKRQASVRRKTITQVNSITQTVPIISKIRSIDVDEDDGEETVERVTSGKRPAKKIASTTNYSMNDIKEAMFYICPMGSNIGLARRVKRGAPKLYNQENVDKIVDALEEDADLLDFLTNYVERLSDSQNDNIISKEDFHDTMNYIFTILEGRDSSEMRIPSVFIDQYLERFIQIKDNYGRCLLKKLKTSDAVLLK